MGMPWNSPLSDCADRTGDGDSEAFEAEVVSFSENPLNEGEEWDCWRGTSGALGSTPSLDARL